MAITIISSMSVKPFCSVFMKMITLSLGVNSRE